MIKELPVTLYTSSQTRLLDKTAIEQAGLPGFTLMMRAGRAVFSEIQRRWPDAKRLTVLCGRGNNGGDGFVVAALAKMKGYEVQARFIGDDTFHEQLEGEAREAWLWATGEGVMFQPFQATEALVGEVVCDALLGTGLSGEVRDEYLQAIHKINRLHRSVIAVDIPSGLCADTGSVLGSAVKANVTITFIGLKQGLFMNQAPDYVGDVVFDGLRIPESVYEEVSVSAFRLSQDDVTTAFAPRAKASHKGMFGHVLVVGGDEGYGGAAIMAAEAALYSGAGKVSLATRACHVTAMLARAPEVMVHAVESGSALTRLLEQADVIVFGPGLGKKAWADQMLQAIWSSHLPVVVDADGLNILLLKDKLSQINRSHWVITPHPGEAASLLDLSTAEIQRNRIEAVRALQELIGGTAVLKGAGTLITDGDVIHLCSAGNPGMATGGMGDILSGIIGALIGQGLAPVDAARVGVYLHSAAADQCVLDTGERGLRATDLLLNIRSILNGKNRLHG